MIRHLFKLIWNRKRANALIITEIFFSFLVIFVVAALAAHLIANYRAPLGFDARNVWNVSLDGPMTTDEKGTEAKRAVMAALIRETKSFPQVSSASTCLTPPYSFSTREGGFRVDGRDVRLTYDEVSDEFAKVMGVHVIAGRWFRPEDDALNFLPVVIDANTAKAMYSGKDPIGQKFDVDGDTELRVVGVVSSYRKDGETSSPVNMVFKRASLTDAVKSREGRNIVLKVLPGTRADFEAALLERLHGIAPGYEMRVQHMDAMRDQSMKMRLAPVIIGFIIASFLIVMVTLGLTGVLWQNVTARTRELGLRRALGATGALVHRQILSEVAIVATFAVLLGVIVVLQIPLMGLFTWLNQAAYLAAIGVTLATIYSLTLLCGLYPSWLAGRVQPAEALHYD